MVNEVEANETNSTVNGLTEAVTYSVTIVAESNTLRSNTTGPENITLGDHECLRFSHWHFVTIIVIAYRDCNCDVIHYPTSNRDWRLCFNHLFSNSTG